MPNTMGLQLKTLMAISPAPTRKEPFLTHMLQWWCMVSVLVSKEYVTGVCVSVCVCVCVCAGVRVCR